MENEPVSSLRLVVVGGGKGGAGKSLISQNLAVYFAQLGKNVILVDADPGDTNLHTHFGLSASKAGAPVPTSVPGLRLIPAAHDTFLPEIVHRDGGKRGFMTSLRGLDADYIVLDVGPGHRLFALDAMLGADLAIAVTVPEPPAIEATYSFIRAAFLRRIRWALRHDRARVELVERAALELGDLPPPIELAKGLSKLDKTLSEFVASEASRFHFHLVVNQTRVRSDIELGTWMSGLCERHYGVKLDEIGHIEHDDAVWVTVRKTKPLLIDNPASKAARNLERIARRAVAILKSTSASSSSPTLPNDEIAPPQFGTPSLYAALRITRSASDEEIRRSYKRQSEIYSPSGLATWSLLTSTQLNAERARLDEAYDTLLDPVRRRAYDLSLFPDADIATPSSGAAPKRMLEDELTHLQHELAREIGPETEFTGPLLQRVRESQGLSTSDVVARTKITLAHVEAIEAEKFSALPPLVYVRGFVIEVAKFLKLDHAQVQKTYLRRMRKWQSESRIGSIGEPDA